MSRVIKSIFGGKSKEDKQAAALQAAALKTEQLRTQADTNRANLSASEAEQSRLRGRRAGRLKALAFIGSGEQGLSDKLGG
ncbi:MAG: hypothetical protein RLZZ157_69 [Pseudomonadota bacterium]|jgi:hypothetical protein